MLAVKLELCTRIVATEAVGFEYRLYIAAEKHRRSAGTAITGCIG
jgi:hypothetical protein